MRKFLLVLVCLFLMVGIAQAREVITEDVKTAAGSADIGVVTANTVYTRCFTLDESEYNAVSYYAVSDTGSVNVGIELEQSWTTPTTEGTVDTNYAEAVAMSDIATAMTTESTWYHKALSAPSMKYGRFKITGAGSNTADTVVNMKIHKRIN